jgi:hypothetical protein
MQQLGSNYRGDTSETLGSIMQGQYAPLAMLNQFTSGITNTAMNNASANTRTQWQLNTQSQLEREKMKQQGKQFEQSLSLQEILTNAQARAYDYRSGGSDDNAERQLGEAATGAISSRINDLQLALGQMDPSDPEYAIMKDQIGRLQKGLTLSPSARAGFAKMPGGIGDRLDTASTLIDARKKKVAPPGVPAWAPTEGDPLLDSPQPDYYSSPAAPAVVAPPVKAPEGSLTKRGGRLITGSSSGATSGADASRGSGSTKRGGRIIR